MQRAHRTYSGAGDEERRWANILTRRGHTLVPMSQALGNTQLSAAPLALTGNGSAARLPDFLSFRHNGRVQLWTELKTKTQPGRMRLFRRWEHGIDLVKWQDYVRVWRETGIPLLLVVHELNSPPSIKSGITAELAPSDLYLFADIQTLHDKGRYEPNWPTRGVGGWLWARRDMEVMDEALLPGMQPV